MAYLPKTNTNGMERVATGIIMVTIPRPQPYTSNSTWHMEAKMYHRHQWYYHAGEEAVFYHTPEGTIRHGILPQ